MTHSFKKHALWCEIFDGESVSLVLSTKLGTTNTSL